MRVVHTVLFLSEYNFFFVMGTIPQEEDEPQYFCHFFKSWYDINYKSPRETIALFHYVIMLLKCISKYKLHTLNPPPIPQQNPLSSNREHSAYCGRNILASYDFLFVTGAHSCKDFMRLDHT